MQHLQILICYENMQKICINMQEICNICKQDYHMQNMQEYALPTLLMKFSAPSGLAGSRRGLDRVLAVEPRARWHCRNKTQL